MVESTIRNNAAAGTIVTMRHTVPWVLEVLVVALGIPSTVAIAGVRDAQTQSFSANRD